MAGMWHATGLQATGAPPPSPVAQSQNGVDVQAISNLAIGFFAFFGTRRLVRVRVRVMVRAKVMVGLG